MRACAAGSLPPSPLPISAAGANDGAVGTGIDAARLHLASPAPEGGEAPSISGAALGGLTAAAAAPGRLPHVRLADLTALWATGAADHVGAPLIEFLRAWARRTRLPVQLRPPPDCPLRDTPSVPLRRLPRLWPLTDPLHGVCGEGDHGVQGRTNGRPLDSLRHRERKRPAPGQATRSAGHPVGTSLPGTR